MSAGGQNLEEARSHDLQRGGVLHGVTSLAATRSLSTSQLKQEGESWARVESFHGRETERGDRERHSETERFQTCAVTHCTLVTDGYLRKLVVRPRGSATGDVSFPSCSRRTMRPTSALEASLMNIPSSAKQQTAG